MDHLSKMVRHFRRRVRHAEGVSRSLYPNGFAAAVSFGDRFGVVHGHGFVRGPVDHEQRTRRDPGAGAKHIVVVGVVELRPGHRHDLTRSGVGDRVVPEFPELLLGIRGNALGIGHRCQSDDRADPGFLGGVEQHVGAATAVSQEYERNLRGKGSDDGGEVLLVSSPSVEQEEIEPVEVGFLDSVVREVQAAARVPMSREFFAEARKEPPLSEPLEAVGNHYVASRGVHISMSQANRSSVRPREGLHTFGHALLSFV